MRSLSFVLLTFAFTATLYAQPRLVGAPEALTSGGAYAAPAFSPSGDALAFTTPRFAGLFVMPAGADAGSTAAPRALTLSEGVGFGFAWAPDGTALAARTSEQVGARRLHRAAVYDVASGEAAFLTEPRDRMATLPAWSADGSQLVLPQNGTAERLATGRAPLRGKAAAPRAVLAGTRLAIAEPGAEALRDVHPFSEDDVLSIAASPDGQRVAFKRYGDGVYVMNRDGSGLARIGDGEEPAWSPDGQWVAVQRTSDDGYVFTGSDLYLLRADGSETVRLTDTPDALEMRPTFSPDGRALVYDDGGVIYRVGIALR